MADIGVTEIKVDVPSSWLQRIRLAFKSPHVAYLEQRVRELEEREKALLDRLLVRNGVGSLTNANERKSIPNVVPVHPWRVMAQREAAAWDDFNEKFPSMDEVAAERKS